MLKRTLLFAALHVAIVIAVVVVMIVTGPTDSAEPEGFVTRSAGSLLEILGQPGIFALERFNPSGNDFVEWSFLGFTSLLWGAMFASFTRPHRGAEEAPRA